MHTKSMFIDTNENHFQRIISLLLVLAALIGLSGCSPNLVQAGKDGIDVEAGDWNGTGDDRPFSIGFEVGTNGENIFIYSFSYPCGDQTAFVSPPSFIKAKLQSSAFELTTTDTSDMLPKLVITGTFTDSTHVEGTWDFFGEQITPDMGCSPANGTWQGSPASE